MTEGQCFPRRRTTSPQRRYTRVGQRGSGHLAAFLGRMAAGLIKTGTYAGYGSGGEAVGKPGVVGVYTSQRLNLSRPWEGLQTTGQGFKPDSGNPTVRHYRGASGNVRHGETVTPSRNRKSENGNPSPTAGRARFLSRPKRGVALSTLHHVIDLEWMKEAFRLTRKDGAPGIDGVTAAEYAENLEANLLDLLDRIKSGRYQAPPVRRVYIPKGDRAGSRRPLGLPTFEDKVCQRAIVMVLELVYEEDFLPCSYGFRPGRSAHQALHELRTGFMSHGLRWVIDLDIEKYS
jgi:Reverse transcriptase (RNA-dependent DNA polymerase)